MMYELVEFWNQTLTTAQAWSLLIVLVGIGLLGGVAGWVLRGAYDKRKDRRR